MAVVIYRSRRMAARPVVIVTRQLVTDVADPRVVLDPAPGFVDDADAEDAEAPWDEESSVVADEGLCAFVDANIRATKTTAATM
jgi:hypothetical protein